MSRLLKTKYGFVLLEVILSLAILSIGITLILSSFSTYLKAVRTVKNYNLALSLLEEKAEAIELNPKDFLKEKRGIFEEEPDFSWSVTPLKDRGTSLVKIILAVSWKEEGEEKEIDLITYITT